MNAQKKNLSKLSSEASEKGEGKITIEECQNISKTFKLGELLKMMACQLNFIMSFGRQLVKWWSKALTRLMKREKCLTHKGKASLHLSKNR